MYYSLSGLNKPLIACDGPVNTKIVMSLWTKPLFSDAFYFSSVEDFLAFWVLSVKQASKLYPVEFFCDSLGKELIFDKLGLSSCFIRTNIWLDRLNKYEGSLWALGKIQTYLFQNQPFIHIDHDVFLWQRLPCHIENADMVAQSPERWLKEDQSVWWYDLAKIRSLGLALPHTWITDIDRGGLKEAANAGILGGQNVFSLKKYAEDVFFTLHSNQNEEIWKTVEHKHFANTILEQYNFVRRADNDGVPITYLFPEGYGPTFDKTVGYTHLMGHFKREPEMIASVWREIEQYYPEYLPRIKKTANYLRSLIEQKNNISKGAYTMATDLKFKTRALVSIGAEGVVLNSNLSQTAAIQQESVFNTAYKGVTGNDLNRLYVQTTAEGTVVGFNGEGIHADVQDGISLHCPDELASSISKQSSFIAALSSITGGYPVSEVGMDTEVVA